MDNTFLLLLHPFQSSSLLNSSPADVELISNQLRVHSIVYYTECNASIVIFDETHAMVSELGT